MKRVAAIVLFLSLSASVFSQEMFSFFNREKEPETVEELTNKLVAGISNDSLKVRKIYTWITSNVSYDYNVYMSGQPIRYQSPELVYRRRKTTCTGYSNLMVSMLETAGIPAYTVEGFTHDFVLGLDSSKLASDHAWVAFSLNGNWHVADPTWDAGDIGIMRSMSTEVTKKTIWQRLRSFKLKNIFKKKSKKKTTKMSTRTKVSYKIGFTRLPTTEYIFTDPDVFLKTHLPNMAHVQMKSALVTVEQFCDSSHSLGERYYDQKGSFNFNQLNDAYYKLEIPERLLWISDSSLNYHYLNHGDKSINAHNYLVHFYGGRTNTRHLLEKYCSIADSVILHGNLAIQVNRNEFKKKRIEFSKAFTAEKKFNQAQLIQVNYIRSHIARNTEIYRKCRERMKLKELVTIGKWEQRIHEKYGNSSSPILKPSNDTLLKVNEMTRVINAYRDTVTYFQEKEKKEGHTFISSLSNGFYAAQMSMFNDAVLQYEGVFLNEKALLEKDRQVADSLAILTGIMRDSINAYLSNRRSFSYIMKLDQEIKKQANIYLAMEKKDSVFKSTENQKYANLVLLNLLETEKEIINERLERSTEIESALRNQFVFQARELGQDMKDLSFIRTQRQAYLVKMMNNKFNRSIRVYTIIVNNAKNWKRNYKAKLKALDQQI
jgi:hypothetical protein